MWFNTCLACPLGYRKDNLSSFFAELKHTMMRKCTTFSSSGLFHRVLRSARTGSTRHQKTLWSGISADCTSNYLDGLMDAMHLIFAESLNLSQVKDPVTQIHNILYYIAEVYPLLKHWCGVYAALLHC